MNHPAILVSRIPVYGPRLSLYVHRDKSLRNYAPLAEMRRIQVPFTMVFMALMTSSATPQKLQHPNGDTFGR